ncbi:hypothetical protein ACQ5SO_19500 [Rhodovulum sp. DZ06]|uniref:hypothetical protein n=1 Tax=Rhodovulum sp. DZ06 TaxID=3425126 RepID=UPI003D32A820
MTGFERRAGGGAIGARRPAGAPPPPSRATALRLRWGEFAVSAALALILLRFGLENVLEGGIFGWSMVLLGGASVLWARLAFLRGLAGGRAMDPGVVMIEERRITYLGPETGGVLSLDELRAVDVESGPNATWILRETGGPALRVPAGASGVESLPEALAALPGFSEAQALKAIAGAGPAMHAVWRRGGDVSAS